MYEKMTGSNRLAEAFERAINDPERLNLIADLLYYDPEQLKQDAQAVYDVLQDAYNAGGQGQ